MEKGIGIGKELLKINIDGVPRSLRFIPELCPLIDQGEFHWPDTFHWELKADIGSENRSVVAAYIQRGWRLFQDANPLLVIGGVFRREVAENQIRYWEKWINF